MDKLVLKLGNVHCQSCIDSIKECVTTIFESCQEISLERTSTSSVDDESVRSSDVTYNLNHNVLTLIGSLGVLSQKENMIISSLQDRGFDIESVNLETEKPQENSIWYPFHKMIMATRTKARGKQRHHHHLEMCLACEELKKKEQSKVSLFRKVFTSSSSDDQSTLLEETPFKPVVHQNMEYRAVIALSGVLGDEDVMAIENAIRKSVNPPLSNGDHVTISPDHTLATIIIPNKQHLNAIISSIRNEGFSLSLLELAPVERIKKFKVTAAIGGMTCLACSSAIEHLVLELPFVVESAINAVSKSGIFIVDSDLTENLETLKEAVEDVGYDYEVVKVSEVVHASKRVSTRTLVLTIDGMFCDHCPESINTYLSTFGSAVVINEPATMSNPSVKITYQPSPPLLTMRKILAGMAEEFPNFKFKVLKEPTLEDRLKAMAHKETMKVFTRLLLSLVVAIPTFIIGIVCMSLLPKHHHLRMWFMEPVWAGNVSRAVWLLFILATPIYFAADDIFHRRAVKEIMTLWKSRTTWKRRLFKFGSMNLLMSLGTSVAYFASLALLILSACSERESDGYSTTYFDSVVFLTFFLLIGRILESVSKGKTADAVMRLTDIKPKTAHMIEKISDNEFGNDHEIIFELLEVGDYIRVSPGESPAADSIIEQGESQFDESALTGESIPVTHCVGEQVYAGTVNSGSSAVICKILALDGYSLIDQIVNAVRDGQLNRAPIERTAETLTGIFVPIICFLAVCTWIIWLALGYGNKLPTSYLDIDVGGWCVWSMEFSIAVFVVACPCGIGLAAPTAIFVGSGLAAKYGVLARGGGAAFQEGAKVEVVCFDKTGTLTMGGDLKVTDYAVMNEVDDLIVESMSLQIAKDMESSSRHPLAVAVKEFAESQGSTELKNRVPEIQEVPGKGLKGDINNTTDASGDSLWKTYQPESAIIGNEKLLNEHDTSSLSKTQKEMLEGWKKEGKSVVLLAIKCPQLFKSNLYVPTFMMAARDQVRPEAKSVIALLQKQNISCWMISGDNSVTANAVALQLGITNVVAEVLPEEKALKVVWLQKTFHNSQNQSNSQHAIVCMIGDGINDAPALAAADVGISLASGSDLAMTSSDFVLLAPKYPLISLLNLFSLSKAVFNRIKFNFGWAIVYNAIGIPISAGVIYPYNNSRLSPVWASAAMALSSISVVLSSLALKFFKPPKTETEDTELEQVAPQRVVC